ncbi:MAG: choice-of-anchor D domain-containing protein [Calditrichaeota bacterium]|nr:MAG: choice-of-anchor D domain-containing protein [Calditrichota bacterium]
MSKFTNRIVVLICYFLTFYTGGLLAQVQDTLWTENWEGDWTQDWHVDGGTWEVGMPTSGPDSAFKDEKCAATVLAGNYSEPVDSRLIRHTTFVVPAASENPRLRFWHWYSISSGDYGQVLLRVKNGEWEEVSPKYIRTSCDLWTNAYLDISAYADSTVEIAFYFHTREVWPNPDVSSGWYIDEISLIVGPVKVDFPENWETGIGDWYAEPGLWQVGEPTTGPLGGYQSLNCAATVLDDNYCEPRDARLISQPFDVPAGSSNPRLRFWHWYSLSSADYGAVQIKVEDGEWTTISEFYKRTSCGFWTRAFIDLSEWAGLTVEIAFYFHSEEVWPNPDVSSGWYIDELEIETGAMNFCEFENWETGIGDWYVDFSMWQVGTPTSGPGSGYLSPSCAATVLEGNYCEPRDTRLISPWFTVPPADKNPALTFWHWFSFSSSDNGRVQLRTKHSDWKTISDIFTNTSADVWTPTYYPLSAYADSTVQIAFYFHSQEVWPNPDVSTGWYIDDIKIIGMDCEEIWTITPNTHNFGDVLVGDTTSAAFTIKNTGTDSIQFTSVHLKNTDDTPYSLENAVFYLAPDSSRNITVKFTPDARDGFTNTLIIESDAGTKEVPLSGTGIAPVLVVEPDTLTFPEIIVNTEAVDSLFVSNGGDADLHISAVEIGGEDAAFFTASEIADILVPGARDTLIVTFKPDAPRDYHAKLEISSDGGDVPIILLGQAMPNPSDKPYLANITDIPNDQGKQVLVAWTSSQLDQKDSEQPITEYGLWRRVDHLSGTSTAKSKGQIASEMPVSLSSLTAGSDIQLPARSTQGEDLWTFIASSPAMQAMRYSLVAPTLFDSTATDSIVWSVFFVSAHTADPDVWFVSQADSGYSVDNLAPAIPSGLIVSETDAGVELFWDANEDDDFDYFSIYRGSEADFAMNEPFAQSIDPFFVDSSIETGGNYFYKVTAMDFSGNETSPSAEVTLVVTAVSNQDKIPKEYTLAQNHPNPFNPETSISFSLPIAGPVTIRIFDLLGKEILTLVDGQRNAGSHVVQWNGRNSRGVLVPSGVYVYRMVAGDFTASQKMLLLQ